MPDAFAEEWTRIHGALEGGNYRDMHGTSNSPSSRASSGCYRTRNGKRTGLAALRIAVELRQRETHHPQGSRDAR